VVGLLALRNSPVRNRTARLAIIGGLIFSFVVIVISARIDSDGWRTLASAWTGVLLLFIVVLLVRQILLLPAVTIQSIFGAISAYLIIGLMFAAFYAAIYYLEGRQFFARQRPANASTFQYFSFTTLTTLGYGDFTAAGSSGRAVAMIEAMTGQIFLATLVARLVASFRPQARVTGAQSPDPD
jgi:energy-coupling factor transporter transmembrane protein EcfT